MNITTIRKNDILNEALIIFISCKYIRLGDGVAISDVYMERKPVLAEFWLNYQNNGSKRPKGPTNSICMKWMWQWSRTLLKRVCLFFLLNQLLKLLKLLSISFSSLSMHSKSSTGQTKRTTRKETTLASLKPLKASLRPAKLSYLYKN